MKLKYWDKIKIGEWYKVRFKYDSQEIYVVKFISISRGANWCCYQELQDIKKKYSKDYLWMEQVENVKPLSNLQKAVYGIETT